VLAAGSAAGRSWRRPSSAPPPCPPPRPGPLPRDGQPGAGGQPAQAAATGTVSPAGHVAGEPDFGPNVYVFTPSMPLSQIQATVDSIASQQIPNQFGTQRYALLFEPGTARSSRAAGSSPTRRSPAAP
jgi:hypothetical protein